jgi:hypothetical protein
MGSLTSRVGKAAARSRQIEQGNSGRLSAAAMLDCLYCLLGTAALYFWFGDLHRQGTPSRALVAALTLSPLIAGIVLGLRGHVLPMCLHVQWGISNALSAIVPLLGLRAGDLQRLSWRSAGQVLFMLALIALASGVCSLAGTELGGIVHRLRQTKGLDQYAVARAQASRRIRSFESAGVRIAVVVALIGAGGSVVAAVIAKL